MPSSSPTLAPSIAQRLLSGRKTLVSRSVPIVVHCHLSWDNVWQRPQQYLSRLAAKHPILFVETEVREGVTSAFYEYRKAARSTGVTQLKIVFPPNVWGDGDYVDRERRRLLKTALLEPALRKYARPVQWFYDPMAVTAFLGHMDECLVVYDCMDELSKFRNAPAELIRREAELLKQADLVFCGGQKLHEAKKKFHSDCHFYSCGVDVEHFSAAREKTTPVPDDMRTLPKPIYGYYGVVDERIDYELLLKLAQSSVGSVVVVGPTAKVKPEEMPNHPRLHWLGRREYDQLPAYAKSFDVCLMPFALNESTEYINPTKALEYLATSTPIVSTAVPDVVTLFADVVRIAQSHEEFVAMCLRQSANSSPKLLRAGIRRAEASTWERLTGEIEKHLTRKIGELATSEGISSTVLSRQPRSI